MRIGSPRERWGREEDPPLVPTASVKPATEEVPAPVYANDTSPRLKSSKEKEAVWSESKCIP